MRNNAPMKLGATLFLLATLTFAQNPASTSRTVIIVSLDGFPAYALENAKTPVPVLRELAAGGTQARRMMPINPTVTWPITPPSSPVPTRLTTASSSTAKLCPPTPGRQ